MRTNYEIPKHRLAVLDSRGSRVGIFPIQVRGWFRPRRAAFEALLLAIFFALPIVHVGGHPAVLVDIARRQFYFFGMAFFATDAPLGLLLIAAFFCLLMATSALWGRVWCGWACPQTVIIDLIYRNIEQWIEGNARARRLLDDAPWNARKIALRALKWSVYVAVSALLAHAFVAYFEGWSGLREDYARGFVGDGGAKAMLILAMAIFLFDFGWFRELFCIIACPYGRWQSVWLDERSMVVGYNASRGEPRRGVGGLATPKGDCVSCYRCVRSCPTGIDIRRGTQMECIACTACIDACDEVMVSLGKSPGLIRYTSQAQDADPVERLSPFRLRWRLRPIAYLAVAAIAIAAFGAIVAGRSPINLLVIRMPGAPFLVQPLADGSRIVTNTLRISVRNQWDEPVRISLSTSENPEIELLGDTLAQTFAPGEQRSLMIIARARQQSENARLPSSLRIDANVLGDRTLRAAHESARVPFLHP